MQKKERVSLGVNTRMGRDRAGEETLMLGIEKGSLRGRLMSLYQEGNALKRE